MLPLRKNKNVGVRARVILLSCFLLILVAIPGCKKKVDEVKPQGEQQAEQKEKPAPEKRPNLVKRKTSEVLDKNKAIAENPKLIEVENKINAGDPLTASLQGYVAASSRINVLNFQHQIDLMKAMNENGANVTYQQIIDLIKQTNFEFNALPDYQHYAYDEKAGKFLILEDPEEKKRIQGK